MTRLLSRQKLSAMSIKINYQSMLSLDDARNKYKDCQYAVVEYPSNVPICICKTIEDAREVIETRRRCSYNMGYIVDLWRNEKMIITGMNHFQNVAKKKLVEWYHEHKPEVEIDLSNVFVVWSCKTLQNYKCLASTDISGDGIYAEYTYNGDKQELYEDVYGKITNTCHTEE